jgi:hypothetical protein
VGIHRDAREPSATLDIEALDPSIHDQPVVAVAMFFDDFEGNTKSAYNPTGAK